MSGNYPYINNYTDDLELPKGWEDVSYHNDALPSWMTSSNQQVGYHVWIDSWDIEERKNNAKHIYGIKDEKVLPPRFHVVLGYGASKNLFMSNDLSEVVEWVKNNPKTKEQLKQTEEECY